MRWRISAGDKILPGVSEERFLRAAREYARSAFPNADRVGCPGRNRLKALAHDRCRPADEAEDVQHVATCSPCFAEYETIRRVWRRQRTVAAGALIAACLAIIGVAGFFFFGRSRTPQPFPEQLVDLRPFESFRGAAPGSPSPIVLRRENLMLVILLPIGSGEGQYVLRLLDASSATRIETTGNAMIKNYVTTLEAPFDLRSLPPGRFTLTIRRAASLASTSYPVEIL
jgi:hypothetical protein